MDTHAFSPSQLFRRLALFLWLPCFGLTQLPAQGATGPAATPAPAATLSAAQTALASTSPADLAAKLGPAAASLAPADALTLLRENAERLPSASSRAAFLGQAAGYALLLGRFSEAGELYERQSAQSVSGDADALLRAARCRLAAGENDEARELASRVLIAAKDPLTASRARLVAAWALYFSGRAADAKTLAAELARASPLAAERCEALFLVWTASAGGERSAAAAALAKSFPDSPEALIATGSLQPAPLPHWYLGSLSPSDLVPSSAGQGGAPQPSGPVASPATPGGGAEDARTSSSAPASAGSSSRLQVGYFSVEANATSFAAELKGKGFSAGVEVRSPGEGSTSGTRWIVYVEGGSNLDAMRLKLKDAGYESYPMD